MSSQSDSEFQRLTKRLRVVEQRVEAKQRARKQAKQNKKQAKQQTEKITLKKFLEICYEFFKCINIETKAFLTTENDSIISYNQKYLKRIIS